MPLTSHSISSTVSRDRSLSYAAMSPFSPSFPGNGTICISCTEGAMDVGMSVLKLGSPKFITPS